MNTHTTEKIGTSSIPDKGLSQEEVLKEVNLRLKSDVTYDSGKVMGSMCTNPHPLGSEIYACFIDRNLGDSGLFPATVQLEIEAIEIIGSLLSNPGAVGHIVTGGTEANILALWAAQRLSKKKEGNIIVPASAHCSFDKAADLLGLKLVKVGLNSSYQVDVDAVETVVGQNTVAIVGIAGTTSLGVVDPIPALSQIAARNETYLHVDAAFGGFILPFLADLGLGAPDFDFSLPGVCSITVDPHKMGLAPFPAGGILFRNRRLKEAVTWRVPYLSGGETYQGTLAGTRSGASAIAVWALLKHFGREGYTGVVRRCMDLTQRLAEEIPKIEGLDIVTKPVLNVIGLRSETIEVRLLAKEVRAKGWAVALFPRHIRIVLMPHVNEEHVVKFLRDLKTIVSTFGD